MERASKRCERALKRIMSVRPVSVLVHHTSLGCTKATTDEPKCKQANLKFFFSNYSNKLLDAQQPRCYHWRDQSVDQHVANYGQCQEYVWLSALPLMSLKVTQPFTTATRISREGNRSSRCHLSSSVGFGLAVRRSSFCTAGRVRKKALSSDDLPEDDGRPVDIDALAKQLGQEADRLRRSESGREASTSKSDAPAEYSTNNDPIFGTQVGGHFWRVYLYGLLSMSMSGDNLPG